MKNYREKNKQAWEFNAYDFWVEHLGYPIERAKKDIENPKQRLKKHAQYFENYKDVKVANICGSCGKKAIPLALLGSDVTVFDISEQNKKYASEVAQAAQTKIDYVVGDVLEINLSKYRNYFDIVFMEGGILHYFHNIDQFMSIMNQLLKPGGKMICSDFHPFTKISDVLDYDMPTMNYFSTEVIEGEMAHARFYPQEIRNKFPLCSYRKYTISEIINSVINNNFTIKQFDEHPSWNNEKYPGEFTLIGIKDN